MTLNAKVAAVETYIQALNDANLAAIENLYAADAVLEDPVGTPSKHGLTDISAFYAGAFANGGITAKLTGPVRVAGNCAAFAFSITFNGMLMEIIDVFQFNDADKIIDMKAYWSEANISPAA